MLTINNKKLCELCFSEIPLFSDTCSQCDGKCLNEIKGTKLAKGTILCGRYLVGNNIGYGNSYICYDLKTNRKLMVYEFFPSPPAYRKNENNEVVFDRELYNGDTLHQKISIDTFIDEVRTSYRLRYSPYSLDIYDLFSENNTAYCITEYFNRKFLYRCLSESEALYVMIRLMDALEYFHNIGLTYKYLDKEKVLIDEAFNIKLWPFPETDYKCLSLLCELTTIGLNPNENYPIELYRKNLSIGPWTDIFSLGVVLYGMILGKEPENVIDRIQDDSTLDFKGISFDFSRILNKMMELFPKDRYQNINELRHDVNLLKLKPKPPFYFS